MVKYDVQFKCVREEHVNMLSVESVLKVLKFNKESLKKKFKFSKIVERNTSHPTVTNV